ncbi:hypothetical protein AB0K14_13820 [Actinosynnema sp. NPDC050801]|uniref:hypothetical protein n=1 Tax=unclassified Actinosynnema TaxID=2637065 RepID=UPI0033D16975
MDAVEGGFRLSSQNADSARALFEVSSRSTGTRSVHVVWLDEVAARASGADRNVGRRRSAVARATGS